MLRADLAVTSMSLPMIGSVQGQGRETLRRSRHLTCPGCSRSLAYEVACLVTQLQSHSLTFRLALGREFLRLSRDAYACALLHLQDSIRMHRLLPACRNPRCARWVLEYKPCCSSAQRLGRDGGLCSA